MQHDRRSLKRLLSGVSSGAALTSFGIGCLVLVGWWFDIPALKSVSPGLISTKAVTALCFMLIGLSGWLSQEHRAQIRVARYGAWGGGFVVASLGLLTLAEYAFGRSLGIDQLLLTESPGTPQTIVPGRMAPNTAFSLALLGLGVLLLDVRTPRGHRPAQYLIGVAGLVFLAALVGYFYGVTVFYSPATGSNPMALPTAVAGAAAAVGLWLARPGPRLLAVLGGEQAGSLMARHFLLPALLLPLLLDLTFAAGERAGLYGREFASAIHVVALTALLLALVVSTAMSLNRADAGLAASRGAQSAALPEPLALPSALSAPLYPGRRWLRYVAALLLPVAAAMVRLGFFPGLGTRNVYVLFYPAVTLAALYGGLPAGLLATLGSALLAACFFIEPTRSFAIEDPAEWLSLGIFCLSGLLISLLAETMHRAHRRAASAEEAARQATERERVEQELRESEEQFRTLADSIPNLAWWANADGYLTWYNQRWYEYTGTTPQQMEGWGWQSVHDPATLPAVLERWKASLASGEPFDMTFPLRGADGIFRPFLTRVIPLKDAQGRVQRWFGTNTDVSEQQEAQEAVRRLNTELQQRLADLQVANEQVQAVNASLQVSRRAALNLMEDALTARRQAEEASVQMRRLAEQRRLALEAADLGAWDYDFRAGQVFWDERCREMWGMTADEHVAYATAISRIHPEDRAGVDRAVQEALAGRDAGGYHREFRVVWADGSVHWIASHGHVYFEGEGDQRKPVRFVGANLEITAEREASEALRESRERLAAFAAASFEGIVLSDRGRIVDCNEQFAQLVGCTVEELKGRRIEELIAPEDRERVVESIRAGRESTNEHQMLRRDGSRLTVETHGRPSAPDGRGLRHTAVRDITERKHREEQLHKLNRTLQALKDSSNAMVRATSEEEYLHEVCRIAVEVCGHAMVWIGLAEDDPEKSVRPVVSAGFEQGYLETLRVTWADTERGRGPTGTAIRTGKPCGCKDLLTDPQFAPWRAEALKRGYASSLVVPLLAGDRAFGAITLYAQKPDAFTEDEVALLTQLADDVAYCIRTLRLRAERARAERRTEILADTASQLLTTESPQTVVDALCHKVLAFLDCQAFFNFLVDEQAGRLRLNACAGVPDEDIQKVEWLDYGTAVCGCAARDGCRIVAEDIQATPDPRTELVKSFGIQAYACHPLVIERRVLGTLSFGTRTRTHFREEELSLMRAVADLVAIAMERQRAQASLRRANEELEQRVADRTAELQVSEARYRSLVSATSQIVWTTDPAGQIAAELPAWEAFTGQTRDQYQGSGWTQAVHPEDRQRTEAVWLQAVNSRGLYEVEYRLWHRHGEYREVVARGVPLLGEDGSIREWVGTCTDITERKQAQRRRDFTSALLALFAEKTSAREYLDSAVNAIQQWTGCQALGIRIADEAGEIPYAAWGGFEPGFIELENQLSLHRDNCCCIRAISQAFEPPDRSFVTPGGSYRADDAIAFINALPPEKRACYRGNCMKFGFASLVVIPVRYLDKVIGAIHLADSRPNQFPLAVVEFLETMTPLIGEALHRFQTEAELARHRDQLEVLVQQRTRELTDANARLQRTAEELQRSNRDLEQFAYVASHDLQEPLRAVGGYVRLLERQCADTLDDRARKCIAGAFEGAIRMEQLINDLLAFSRVGTRGGQFVPTHLDMVLQRALANLQVSIEAGHASVTHDPLPTLTVDPTQFMQVFQNLIGNALKFRGQAPPVVHIGAKRQDGHWVLSVRDNGIGIDRQFYGKIFQLFQRLHTRKEYPGTGIGLVICKRIIERHGGRIWVESQLGQGATFYFSIPETTG